MNEPQPKIYSPSELLTERLPPVRVTPGTFEQLEKIVNSGISPRMSDHIRKAIELYIERYERAVEISGVFIPNREEK